MLCNSRFVSLERLAGRACLSAKAMMMKLPWRQTSNLYSAQGAASQ